MTTNIKHIPYADQPCDRCGGKKCVAKTWKETIPTFSGTTQVEYSQIICTNKACQLLFDENLEKEKEKKEIVRLQKEEKDKVRKANSLLQVHISKKNKSRI